MILYNEFLKYYNESINEWNYYERKMINPFEDPFLVKDFIKEYFNYGGKSMVVADLVNEMEPMRHTHTVSAYFLGLLIKQNICPDLEILSNSESDSYRFDYLWFLVCLFHDMGYAQENDWMYKFRYKNDAKEFKKQYKEVFINKFPRSFVYDDLGIIFCAPHLFRESFSSQGISQISNNSYIRYNNGYEIKRSRYSRDTVLNYLEYCKMSEEIKHYDHGIVGGLWLYDSLIKNHYKQYSVEKEKNKNISLDNFISSDNLHFCKEQWRIFAYLADCIMSHNMWPATNKTNELYGRCGLNELMLGQYKTIKFLENPILFLLAVADTLEPIKIYSGIGLSDIEIWNGISIQINSKKIKMRIMDSRMPLETISEKVIGIDSWLNCGLEINSKRKELTIYFS